MNARRLTTAATVATVALFAAIAPHAQAGIAPGKTLVASGELLTISANPLAVDPAGRTTVVWDQLLPPDAEQASVRARRVFPGGVAGPVIPLTGTDERSVGAAVGSGLDGRSFAAWSFSPSFGEHAGVKGRWIEPGGTLGPVITIHAPSDDDDAVDVRVVVSNAGVATVLWRNQEDSNDLDLRRVGADGSLAPLVSDVGAGNEPRIVALPTGATVVVWRASDIEGNVVSPAGVSGSVTEISSTCGLCASPGLAVDANGDGLVAWRRGGGPNFAVMGRLLNQSGSPTGTELTIDPDAALSVGIPVNVAADTQDDFMVTWHRRKSGSSDDLPYGRRLDETGAFEGPAQALSASQGTAAAPLLFERGDGVVAWRGAAGTRARAVDPSGLPLGPTPTDLATGAFSVEVAGSPSAGVGALLSQRSVSGSVRAFELSRYLVTPVCTSSQATVVQGKPIAAALDCSGPAIERLQITSAPKHGKLGAYNPATGRVAYTPTPGYAGPDSFSYRAVNDGGQSNVATVTIAVGKDTVKPVVNTLSLKPGKKVAGKPRPLRFKLTYSERAKAKVTVRKRGKDGKFKKIGTVETKKFRLQATPRIKGELLARIRAGGQFRASAVATDRAGNKSATKRLEFAR